MPKNGSVFCDPNVIIRLNYELRETHDLQDVSEVMRLYLDEQISLAKVSELLGLSRYELMEHFERLGIPLRLGSESLDEAQEEIVSAQDARAKTK